MALKKINAVIFDLDNTLYNEEKFYYQYFEIFCKSFNYSFKKFLLEFNIKKEIFKNDILKNALIKIKKYNRVNHNKSFKLLITFNFKIELFKGVLKTFDFLKKNKIKIGILTNGTVKIQKKKIDNLRIKNKIDQIIFAGNFKKQKPFKYSFIKIIKLLKVKPENTIFVGDNYNTDILGAKNLNLFTIHYSKKKRIDKNVDKVALNFSNVKKILEEFTTYN